jgi:hypothetical protein
VPIDSWDRLYAFSVRKLFPPVSGRTWGREPHAVYAEDANHGDETCGSEPE